jgi:GNAT superfamily N-acetyltransferase
VTVVRTYLRLASAETARLRRAADPRLTVEALDPCPVGRYRELYRGVGHDWNWRDRDSWTDEQLAAHLADPRVHVVALRREEETVGYFELVRHAGDDVEIAYFGLLPGFIGQGLGAHLLTEAVEAAWRLGASEVWLHTCTLDHPAALANYRARGFEPFRTETYHTTIP